MRIILISLLFFFSHSLQAQVITQFLPEIHGRSVDALLQARFLNGTQAPVTGSLTIAVSESKYGQVLQISMPSVTFQAGVNIIPRHLVNSMNILFHQNKLAKLISQTNRFPEGEYQFCFIFNSSHLPGVQECFDYFIEPVMPLMLTEPYDKSDICETKPMFQWQPMLPAMPGTQYQLNLVELKKGQSPHEALVYNLPIIQQAGIFAPMLIYPPSAPSLQEGKTYVWQVSAILNGTVLTRSEIWEFTVNCKINERTIPDDGFRNIDDLTGGNYYIADPYLKFSIRYPYNSDKLKYEIVPLLKSEHKIKGLPKYSLKTGINYITIDLEEIRGLENDHYYLLIIEMPNGIKKQLRFLYKESND